MYYVAIHVTMEMHCHHTSISALPLDANFATRDKVLVNTNSTTLHDWLMYFSITIRRKFRNQRQGANLHQLNKAI